MDTNNESILVVKTSLIVPQLWQGIKSEGIEGFESFIKKHGIFKRRGDVEQDPNWKQIIPYMVFRVGDKYFLMQRTQKGSETRLHNLYSLGIGGHINKEDLDETSILDWGKREFEEEIEYKGQFTSKAVGMLNDSSGIVSAVHLGFVILLEGNSEQISVREDKLVGQLVSAEEVRKKYSQMENWSRIAFDFIINAE